MDFIVDCGTVLDEQNVSDEGRWLMAPPWFIALIQKSICASRRWPVMACPSLRNGKVGEIDRFTIYQSRNLLTQTGPARAT